MYYVKRQLDDFLGLDSLGKAKKPKIVKNAKKLEAPKPTLLLGKCGSCPAGFYCTDISSIDTPVGPYCKPCSSQNVYPPPSNIQLTLYGACPSGSTPEEKDAIAGGAYMIKMGTIINNWASKFPLSTKTANDGPDFVNADGPDNWNALGYVKLADGSKYTRKQMLADFREMQSEIKQATHNFIENSGGALKVLAKSKMTPEAANKIIDGSNGLTVGEMAAGMAQLNAIAASSNFTGDNFLTLYNEFSKTSAAFINDFQKLPTMLQQQSAKKSKDADNVAFMASALLAQKIANNALYYTTNGKPASPAVGLKGLEGAKKSSVDKAGMAVAKQALALAKALRAGKKLSNAQLNLLASPSLSLTIGNLSPITSREFDAVFGAGSGLSGLGAFAPAVKNALPWILAGGLLIYLANKSK